MVRILRESNSLSAFFSPATHHCLAPSLTCVYHAGPGEGFDVAKTGDARIGFVGFPSVGKSTLMNTLAGVFSEVAAYEFTTLTTVPGVIKYKVRHRFPFARLGIVREPSCA